jgi:hypothetical protein
MSIKLSNLFDDKLKKPGDLIAAKPQSLSTISSLVEEQELALQKLKDIETVRPKVNYSDFSNFVFFNSALDYFNITGERVLNEYPYDGSKASIEQFLNDCDEYQRYVINTAWPKSSGHLSFKPTSGYAYVSINDVGRDNNTSRVGQLSPGSSSISLEMWCIPPAALTGTEDVMVAFQRASGTFDGYTAYFSSSFLYFSVISGATAELVSASASPGVNTYYACVYDKGSSIYIISGSATEFPVITKTSTVSISGDINLGYGKAYIGSGSLDGKTSIPLTGSLDNIRVWKKALTLADVTSSFNAKQYAQTDLAAVWRFNETSSTSSIHQLREGGATVLDYGGHKLNGTITNGYVGLRSSGSLIPYEYPDLILFYNAPEIQTYVYTQQTSGSIYDKNNDNIITSLLPQQFFMLEELKNTNVLKDFIYIIARYFDQIKTSIDQFLYVLRTNYSNYNQAPDALLHEVARFYGWDFDANFINADIIQYLFGKNILANVEANKELDVKLFEIKQKFWQRALNNLAYIYKTKGTRESVEALLRVYGVNKNFVRLKEYGYKKNTGIATNRIRADKSVYAMSFASGAYYPYVETQEFSSSFLTTECRCCFPTSLSDDMPLTLRTGSIWSVSPNEMGLHPTRCDLSYTKEEATSETGSIIFTWNVGDVTELELHVDNAPIFDGKWRNISFRRDIPASSFKIDIMRVDNGEIVEHYASSSVVASTDISPIPHISKFPAFYDVGLKGVVGAEMWAQEFRVWNQTLSDVELKDHALNFQSYGTEEVNGNPDVAIHFRLNENVVADGDGYAENKIVDYSLNNLTGSAWGLVPDVSNYKKFLMEYNYIAAPDYGFNEDKIRVMSGSTIKREDATIDNVDLALEFNMVDALNEDISQIIATMNNFNNIIGLPNQRFNSTYTDLDILRANYFKRLTDRLNFRVFVDMLEFFDRSFVELIRKLIPANANFLGDEFVVESHMLERPKLQWNYRRKDVEFNPEGVIKILVRE